VSIGIDEDFVARLCVCSDRELICHRSRRHEQGGLLAQHFRHAGFKALHGGLVTEHIIAHLRVRHCCAHAWRGLGDGVTAEGSAKPFNDPIYRATKVVKASFIL
jgi:hypothetical protein